MKTFALSEISTPIGLLTLICDDEFIIRLLFKEDNTTEALVRLGKLVNGVTVGEPNHVCNTCANELDQYFAGKLKVFTVRPAFLGSEFDKKIWNGLCTVPFGTAISYGGLAAKCGVRGARAVGGAVGRNPIPVIVPCHRVIRKDGSIGGFSGGLPIKRKLLELEKLSVR